MICAVHVWDEFASLVIAIPDSANSIIFQNAAIIDFQGMRPGLAEYDLASLLFDPYVELSGTEQSELIVIIGKN